MNIYKTNTMLDTPSLLTRTFFKSGLLGSILLATTTLANNTDAELASNCHTMPIEIPQHIDLERLQNTIKTLRENQQLINPLQIGQQLEPQWKRKNRTIGAHFIGSLFSVVDAVERLGSDTINLVSLSVNKLNDATIDRLGGGKSSRQNTYDKNDNNNANNVNHEALIQLLLNGKLNHLFMNTSISTQDFSRNHEFGYHELGIYEPGKNEAINHESLTHQPYINTAKNYASIQKKQIATNCPIRSRAISM